MNFMKSPTEFNVVARVLAGVGIFMMSSTPTQAAELDDASLSRICRATVAVLMLHDVSIVVAENVKAGIVRTRYAHPNDGSIWRHQCKVDGNSVIWAAVDINGTGTGPGRWRTSPDDEATSFVVVDRNIEITVKYTDGSETKELVEFN
jgi:hypothetical protein